MSDNTPDFFDRHPDYHEVCGYGATRKDDLMVSIGSVDTDIDEPIHFVASCFNTCPYAADLQQLAGPGNTREVPLQARTLSSACAEADVRWPFNTEGARLHMARTLRRQIAETRQNLHEAQLHVGAHIRTLEDLKTKLQTVLTAGESQ